MDWANESFAMRSRRTAFGRCVLISIGQSADRRGLCRGERDYREQLQKSGGLAHLLDAALGK
jgi:hypothetical protein